MIAVEICEEMNEWIQSGKLKEGTVHSIFDHALNVITQSEDVITLLNNTQGMTPFALKVKVDKPIKSMGFQRGMKVTFSFDKILFDDLHRVILIKGIKEWCPDPCFIYPRASLDAVMAKRKSITKYIDERENKEGMRGMIVRIREHIMEWQIADKALGKNRNPLPQSDSHEIRIHQLDKSQQFILPRIILFLRAVKTKNIGDITRLTEGIVGFGPGLTPSVDDFIVGIMVGLIYLSEYLKEDLDEVYRLNAAMIQGIDGRTTLVSMKMLKLAAKGQGSEDLRELMRAYLSDGRDEIFHQKIQDVMSLGSTSGADLLCGIDIASRMMLGTNKGGTK